MWVCPLNRNKDKYEGYIKMKSTDRHLISSTLKVREALTKLDKLASEAILFVVDKDKKLLASLTDGDIRRGLIKGLGLESPIMNFVQPNPKLFKQNEFNLSVMQEWREQNYKLIPVVNENHQVVDIVNFRHQKSHLPIDGVIMAGGKGTRLRPLTLGTPKPLLKIGGKPIIEYNIDRLKDFGVRNITITIEYLGEQIVNYFGDGNKKDLKITYINERKPLGTIGSVALIEKFSHDFVLIMNADLLTNIDYEDMFSELLTQKGDMIVATTPYEVQIPYGVIETDGKQIVTLKEKPTYTYYSNAGIYILKKAVVDYIPENMHFNATDLMETLYTKGKRVVHYPIVDYWLDIGKPHDFEKAKQDIEHIRF